MAAPSLRSIFVRQEIQAIFDLFSHPGFLIGLLGGLLGIGLLSVAGLIIRRAPFGWGLIFAGAVAFGLNTQARLGADIAWRFLLVIAVGIGVDLVPSLLPRVHRAGTAGVWVAAGAAVWAIIGTAFTEPLWMSFAFPVTVVGLGLGMWGLRRLPEADLVGALLAISIAGIWVTVPETDLVNVMVGAALPMGLATLPPVRARVTAAGALALSGIVGWLALEGGIPRPWTVATAWAALATIPLIAFLVNSTEIRLRRVPLVVIHVLYVAAITRVADNTESSVVALLWFLLLIVLLALALVRIPGLREPDEASS